MCLTPPKLLVRRFIANQATNIPAAWTESAIEDEVASTQIRQFEKPLPSFATDVPSLSHELHPRTGDPRVFEGETFLSPTPRQ